MDNEKITSTEDTTASTSPVQDFWRNLAALLKVKTIITLVIIAVLAVLSIITLAIFAARACRVGRSSFYTIAACAASSLLVFQTCLNVFGAVDLLPLTGVTFPFVSNGGSAMVASWGLLAFLKATDTRENASFATSMHQRRRLRTEAQRRAEPVGDPFAQSAPGEEDAHEED